MTKRKITTRVIFDGVIDNTFTQMRQVYTDDKGEYVNCDRNRYYIVDDSFDIVYTTGRAISGKDLLKQHFGVEERAVPILSDDEEALLSGITSSKLFTIEAVKKAFGVEE